MKTRKLALLSVAVIGALGLASCKMSRPGNISQQKVEVHQSVYHQDVPTAEVTAEYLGAMAAHYDRYGDGTVYATVVYDPKSKQDTAMNATQKAAGIADLLRENGVMDTKVDIMPVKDQGDAARVLFTYDIYEARAPRDCTVLPGLEDRNHDPNDEYKMGCSIETMIARQIVHPKDLLGQRKLSPERDGMSAYPIVQPALVGASNSSTSDTGGTD